MPLDIRAHKPKSVVTRSITVALKAYEGDVTVEVEYDPARYNAEVEAAALDDFESKPAQVCRQILSTFVTSWDLEDGGEPIPPTPEGLRRVPLFEVQVPIVESMMADMTELGKQRQNDSPQPLSTARPRRRKS